MDKILIALIKQNENLLIRRDELIGKLDEEVPAKFRRDYAAIRQALELNVGEIFSAKRFDLQSAKVEAGKILHESGMQESRVNFVLETFEKVIATVFPAPIVEEPTQTIKTSPAKKVDVTKKSSPTENKVTAKADEVVVAVNKIFSNAKTIFNKNPVSTSTPPIQNTTTSTSNAPSWMSNDVQNNSTATFNSTSTANDEPAQTSTSDTSLKKLLITLGILLILGFFWHYSFSFGWFAFGLLAGAGGLTYLFTTSPTPALVILIGVILAFFFATSPTTLSLVCGILAGIVNLFFIGATTG